ncbi:hypothetical protein WME89_53140 [Sorangium sp. So ce321]|uniref:hypothetical protein n=1 Tax=Sorangium sp. So ce321 TaxID=3133300 RepID=UPI003F6364CF
MSEESAPQQVADERWAWSVLAWLGFAAPRASTAEDQEQVARYDEVLASWIRGYPGRLERYIGSLAEGLERAAGSGAPFPAETAAVLDLEGEHIPRTFNAIRPDAIFKLGSVVHWRYCPNKHPSLPVMLGRRLCKEIASTPTGELPPDLELTPEMRDWIHLRVQRQRTSSAGHGAPDILPLDLEGMTPEGIEAALAAYFQAPVEALVDKLRPERYSASGFLSADDRLGQVIWEDARKLRELGVDRHALADRLDEAIRLCREADRRAKDELGEWSRAYLEGKSAEEADAARRADEYRAEHTRRMSAPRLVTLDDPATRLEVKLKGYLGYQEDPFCSTVPAQVNEDFILRNLDREEEPAITASLLALSLIRRVCFFEGNVSYRVDPERLARVLGMIR